VSTPDAFADLLAANETFARDFTDAHLAPKAAKGVAILTCFDSRIDPLRVFGLRPGDAKILRNAGARVTDDVIRTLVLAVYLLNVQRIAVVPHTQCRLSGLTDDEVREAITAAGGPDTSDIEFLSVPDGVTAVQTDVERLRAHPGLQRVTIGGLLYELETGRLRPVC
jgi:carbonic anhydrase